MIDQSRPGQYDRFTAMNCTRRYTRASTLVVTLFLLLFFVSGCDRRESTPEQPLKLRAQAGVLLDALGRQVLLRGINARIDGIFDVSFDDGRTPLESIPRFGEADCRFLATELGFNLLRLPVNWSAIEPRQGEYSEAYFKRIERVVDDCYRHGVYTLLDLHQDAWSKEIGEDGAPLWAIVPPPMELLEGPLTDLDQRRLSSQVLAAFAAFFDNEQNLQDAYAAMAVRLALRFKDNPGVIGLELMNEPVLFGNNKKLDAFHLKVGQALRKAVPELTLFFEPDSLRNLLDSAPVGTPMPLSNTVYSPHIYTGVFQGNWKSGETERIKKSVDAAQIEAQTHNAPLFIGEFGHDPKTALGREWIAAALEHFDRVFASWAIWLYEERSQGSWGLYDSGPDETRGPLRSEVIKLIARPFPTRLAGRLQKIAWNPQTLALEITLNRPIEEPHEFSVPRVIYPHGVRVSCDGSPVSTTIPAVGRIQFRCTGSSITITPASD